MRKCKVLFTIILTVFAVFLAVLPASAAVFKVSDKASLLSISEKAEIVSDMQELSEKTGADCYFITYGYDVDEVDYADLCREFNIQNSDNAIILAVSYSRGIYRYRLFTNGASNRKISGGDSYGEVADILDTPAVYNNIKSGRIKEGVSAFVTVTAEAYVTDGMLMTKLLIALCVGLVASFITTISIASGYRRKLKSPTYPLSRFATLKLTQKSDVFLGSHVIRTAISSGNGPSGGSGHGGGGRGSR